MSSLVRRVARSMRVALPGVLLIAGGAITMASPAQAAMTVSGTVQCLDGLPVEGVWIAASGGSGFASWTPQSGYPSVARFSRAGISGSWTVHVGCGGSPSNWKYSPNGNSTTTSSVAYWSCYTPDMSRQVLFCQRT